MRNRDYTAESIDSAFFSEVFGTEVTVGEPVRIGSGQVGMNLRFAALSADPRVPSSVVVKLASPDETSRATGMALRNYEREVKFYREIQPTVDIRVPHCHFADWNEVTGYFVLVMEDMAPAEQGDQILGCTPAEAAVAIDELARLHGPRWNDDTLFAVDWMERRASREDGERLAGLVSMFIPGFADTLGERVQEETGGSGMGFLAEMAQGIVEYVEAKGPAFCVTHGDYRLDNILFDRSSGALSCAVVDWQTPGHGNGIADLAYFIGAGLLPEVRRAHEWELVDRYVAGIERYGHKVDRQWVERHYRREAISGAVMAVVASQIVGRTERGDEMFVAMAARHSLQGMENGALSQL
ncbi:MAG: phosphotransferase family protein [Actinomycetota bacterium]